MQHKHSALLSRRLALKLAVASVLLVSGCTSMSSSSDLDAAMSDLDVAINEVGGNGEQEKLASIARRIEARAQDLAAKHRAFTDNFDRLLSEYDATEAQLEQLIETYATRREALRNDLLHLQDELHAALTPDQWTEVVQALNQTGNALASYTFSEN